MVEFAGSLNVAGPGVTKQGGGRGGAIRHELRLRAWLHSLLHDTSIPANIVQYGLMIGATCLNSR